MQLAHQIDLVSSFFYFLLAYISISFILNAKVERKGLYSFCVLFVERFTVNVKTYTCYKNIWHFRIQAAVNQCKTRFMLKQESCAIAKMTVRCALY